MYQFKEHIDNASHDEFIKSHPLCNLLQSSNWAKVKDNWKSEIVGVYEQSSLIASAMILIKPLPLGFSMMYIPRGPVMDYENKELVTFFFRQIKKWAKKHHCLFVTIDPSISIRSFTLKGESCEYDSTYQSILHNVISTGCVYKGLTTHIDDTIQPRFHAYVYRRDDFEETPPKAVKNALKTVEKKKIMVKAYHMDGVSAFANVMRSTEKRKNIHLRDESYFSLLMGTYGEDAIIYLAQLPIKELLDETKVRLEQNQKEVQECPVNSKKKRFTLEEQQASLLREVKELEENYKSEGENVTVSGALCVKFGDTSEILYAGMDDRYKRYMAPYASFYQCMIWSFQHGCSWCNMGGIEGNLQGGLTKFKEKFDPSIVEFIGEFDFPVNMLFYKLSRFAYKIRKKTLNKG